MEGGDGLNEIFRGKTSESLGGKIKSNVEFFLPQSSFSSLELFPDEKYSILTSSSIQTSFEEQSIYSVKSAESTIFEDRIEENEVYKGELRKRNAFDQYRDETNYYGYPAISYMNGVFKGDIDELDLSNYATDEVNLYILCKKLHENRINHITKLNLSYNHFDKFASVTLSQYLESSMVTQLNLAHCQIGPEAIEILIEGLDLAEHLEIINLSHCNLCDRGGCAIATILKNNEFIKELDLSHNKLELQTGIELGKVLKYNTSLTHFNLSWNNLYFEKGFEKLCTSLKSNTRITNINLSWNGLVGECASSLYKTLKGNNSFKVVNIENNIFTPIELTEVIAGIKKSKTIQEIYIGGNFITENIIKVCITGTPNYQLLSFGESFYMSDQKTIKDIQKFKLKFPHIILIYHGNVLPNPPEPIDYCDIVLSRAKIVAEKPKQKKFRKDMGHMMIQILDMDIEYMNVEEFQIFLDNFKAKLDTDLKEAFIEAFKIKVIDGQKKFIKIDARRMAEKYLKKFPTERPIPQTPSASKPTRKKK